MTPAALSSAFVAVPSSYAGAAELRGVSGGRSRLCRGLGILSVRGGLSEPCRQVRSRICRLASRPAPVHISNQSRLISGGVRAQASETGSDAQLDPREGGDKLVRVISNDAEVSVLCLVATEVVREAQQRHNCSPIAAAALGRTLMGALLVGQLKGDAETVKVVFLGDGPLGQITAVSSDGGFVKGFVGNPLCDALYKENGNLNVGSAVGSGVLSVVRISSKWQQPYTGTVPIYSGEIAEDIAHYLADSEQVNTALGLGVGFDKEVGIKFAGGFLVQILPFCSEETLAKLEKNILKMRPIAEAPSNCKASDIVEAILDGIGVGDYNNAIIPKYGPCGVELLKPRMMRAVASLGPAEVQQILDEQGGRFPASAGSVEVRCEYCGDVAQFSEADLQQVL